MKDQGNSTPKQQERMKELSKILSTEEDSEDGTVRIADEVLAVIAGIATAEIDGVEGMMGGFVDDLSEKLGRPELRRGVKVQTEDKEVSVDLYITVGYGFKIPKIARSIQKNVKNAIENMTELEVTEVNVHVQEVIFPDDEDCKKSISDQEQGGDSHL